MKRTAFLGSIAASVLIAPIAAAAADVSILGEAQISDEVILRDVFLIKIDTSKIRTYTYSSIVNATKRTKLAVRFEDEHGTGTLWKLSPEAYNPGRDEGNVRLAMVVTAPIWAKAMVVGIATLRDTDVVMTRPAVEIGHAARAYGSTI